MSLSATHIGILATLIWTVGNLLVILTGQTPALFVLGALNLLSGVLLLMAQVKRGDNLLQSWRYPVTTYLFALASFSAYALCLYYGFKTAPALEVNSLNYLWPILLTVFVAMLARQMPKAHIWAGLGMGLAGTFVVLYSPAAGMAWQFSAGHALGVGAGVSWAVYSALTRRIPFSTALFTPVFLILGVVFLALHFMLESPARPDAGEWAAILLLGVSRISFPMWDYAMKKGDPIFLSSSSYFIPLFSTLLLVSLGFGGERPAVWLGAVLIVCGCLTVNRDNLLQAWRRLRQQN